MCQLNEVIVHEIQNESKIFVQDGTIFCMQGLFLDFDCVCVCVFLDCRFALFLGGCSVSLCQRPLQSVLLFVASSPLRRDRRIMVLLSVLLQALVF